MMAQSVYHGRMLAVTLLILVVIVYLLLNAVGIFLTAMQLPGTWFMLLVTGCFAAWRWEEPSISIGWTEMAVLLVLAIIGEVLEFITSAIGSKQAGGSTRGAAISVLMSIPGAIIGTVLLPIPIVGTLVGAAIGAGIGAGMGDKWAGRDWQEIWGGAKGAMIGKLTGAAAKVVVAMVMWLVCLIGLFV